MEQSWTSTEIKPDIGKGKVMTNKFGASFIWNFV